MFNLTVINAKKGGVIYFDNVSSEVQKLLSDIIMECTIFEKLAFIHE